MGDNLIRGYLSELDAALAIAPGPRRARGCPPGQATRRAVDDFGAVTVLAAQFVPILATGHVHRCALAFLRTGPLVGALWLVTVVLAAARGLPVASPLVIAAGIVVGAALVAAVPCAVFAVTVTGRGQPMARPATPRRRRHADRRGCGHSR